MTKSDIKNKFLLEHFPTCFALASDKAFDVVIEDTIIALRGRVCCVVKQGEDERFSVAAIVRLLFGHSVREIAKGVMAYVHVWDKESFIEGAKAPEQQARDQRLGDGDVARIGLGLLRGQMADGNQPDNVVLAGAAWAAMISDRQARQAVIRVLSSAAVLQLPTMLRQAGAAPAGRIWLDWDSTGPSIPVCVDSAGSHRYPALKNQLGEFDVSHLVYVRAASKLLAAPTSTHPSVLVKTLDTDILCINMLHKTHAIIQTTLPRSKRSPVWVDATQLAFQMEQRWPDRTMADFCEAYLLSGSDFVMGGVNGVGQVRLMREYYNSNKSLTAEATLLAKRGAIGKLAIARVCAVHHQQKRAQYALEYWIDADASARDPVDVPPLPSQPLGRGWTTNAGVIVCEETMCTVCLANK